MSISSFLRNIIDRRFNYLAIVPLTFWLIADFTAYKFVVTTTILITWSYAYTCSTSPSLWVRVLETNILNILLSTGSLLLLEQIGCEWYTQILLTSTFLIFIY